MEQKQYPISTKVVKSIEFKENKCVILEDYFGFKGVSNLYCTENDVIIWYAEKLIQDDAYVNFILSEELELDAFTWNGFHVKVDINTGRILNQIFTK